MVEERSGPEERIITEIHTVEWISGEFTPLVGRAGPEDDRVGDCEILDALLVAVGEEVSEMERDFGGPGFLFLGIRNGRREFE